MSKKIIITGGLGYIGTELCKIYSGVSRNNEIVVIDNRFISERVNQLRNWNIKFIHGDILDQDLLKKQFNNADIVHHLAGITDVARTTKEIMKSKDEKINLVAIEGTKNVISSMPENCKTIFPSTHVIFEGLQSIKNDIVEAEYPKPILTYSTGKFKNEEQIKKSGKKYAILRLGSVYGYSNGATRVDIMPNFFSKTTSQNGVIKLFSGGHQIKSLVPLLDVARCFKFMEENENINSEVFNLSKDSITVKEVAESGRGQHDEQRERQSHDGQTA